MTTPHLDAAALDALYLGIRVGMCETNRDMTPAGIRFLTFATLSQELRQVPLDVLTTWQADAAAKAHRAALDQAVLRDDLEATKHAGRAMIRWYRDQLTTYHQEHAA